MVKKPITTGRDEKGRLIKGHSGNPSGRPLSDNIPKEVLAEVNKLKSNKDKIEFWDKYLLENPRTTIEVRQVLALIRDSYTPKLKSVETNTKIDTKIEITWVMESPTKDTNPLIDITNSHNDTQLQHLMQSSLDDSPAKSQDGAITATNNIDDLDEDNL